jgi:hypothetical protein
VPQRDPDSRLLSIDLDLLPKLIDPAARRCKVALMRSWPLLLVVTTACGFPMPADVGDDAMPDADAELPQDTTVCYGAFVRVCFLAPPSEPVTLTADTDIDTDASSICDKHNDQMDHYCVIAGAGFSLIDNSIITAHGSKPLVLLSTNTMTLEGAVDVSSKHNGPAGAGASSATTCANSNIIEAIGTSGGYGGSFGGRGAEGEQVIGTDEFRGFPAPAIGFPLSLRGGCPGGAGAMGNGVAGRGLGGVAGAGGGAVALVATTITIDGAINASGAGGRGGPTIARSGGGGGGSGGMVVLDSKSNFGTIRAKVFANGGGGGQGGESGGKGGADGSESKTPVAPGLGGDIAGTLSGDGGLGSFGLDPTPEMVPNDARPGGGGGAGGGAGGFTHAPGVQGAVVAPASRDLPSQ